MERLDGNDLLTRYKRCLEGLTPGGSEFIDDPERCAKTVEMIQEGLMRTLINRVKLLKEIKQAVEELLIIEARKSPTLEERMSVRKKVEDLLRGV